MRSDPYYPIALAAYLGLLGVGLWWALRGRREEQRARRPRPRAIEHPTVPPLLTRPWDWERDGDGAPGPGHGHVHRIHRQERGTV